MSATNEAIEVMDAAIMQIAVLRARVASLEAALEWYARESDEKFQIVDSKGEAIANFASFTSRARAALKDAPQ